MRQEVSKVVWILAISVFSCASVFCSSSAKYPFKDSAEEAKELEAVSQKVDVSSSSAILNLRRDWPGLPVYCIHSNLHEQADIPGIISA